MVVMYSSQALHSSKATDHIQVSWLYCNVPSFCHFESIAKPNNYFKNSLFKTCRTHFHFSRYSVFGTIFKSNCDNLFLEGLCMLIVKGLAICVCLWTSTKVLWQDEILSQLSPSWPLKQTETRLPHNWMLLAVLWLILIFFFLRLNVRVVGEAVSHTSQKGWTYRIRILLVLMALHLSMVDILSHRPAVVEMVTLWRVSLLQIAECTCQHSA